MNNPEEYVWPEDMNPEEQGLAVYSPFHVRGPRRIVTTTLEITTSAPAYVSDEYIASVLTELLKADPYVRKVQVVKHVG